MKMKVEFAKQLKEELLEVMNYAHTVKIDQKSVFHRRTSLKPVHRKVRVYIHEGHIKSEVSYKSL